jgi:hypothetical protein
MEKHQLSSMMIGGLSLLVVVILILPAFADLKDDKKEICFYYHGEWEDGNCNLENENLRDEYEDDVAYAEDAQEEDKRFDSDHDSDKLTGYDEDGERLNVINNDYEDEEEGDD